jgi:hypothetical protein
VCVGRTPAGGAVPAVVHDRVRAGRAAAEGAGGVVAHLDHDLDQAGEGEQQRVVHRVEEALGEVLGGGVAEREDDDRVVGVGGGALGGEREAEDGDLAVAAADLGAESRAVPGGVVGEGAGLGEGPADAAVPSYDGGFVGHGDHGGEADAETAYRAVARVALRGGAEGGEGFDAGRVQGGAGVGGAEDAVAEGEAEAAGHACAGGGVGGVLREFDDQSVPVAAEDEVFLGVGVLPEAGRAGRPGVEHPTPQTGGAERIGTLGGGPHELTHVRSLSSSASR